LRILAVAHSCGAQLLAESLTIQMLAARRARRASSARAIAASARSAARDVHHQEMTAKRAHDDAEKNFKKIFCAAQMNGS
jgi:hypothetical protein